MELSAEQVERYSRHILLPQVGGKGQLKLLKARVLVVGTGGLGSPVSLYLAAAGVGHIGIVDYDVVDVTNLHRQVIHRTARVGHPKVDSAADTMMALNPEVEVIRYREKLSKDNVMELLDQYDLVVDGTDNFSTRYLVNDACVLTNKVNVHGSVFRFDGQATVFDPQRGPCYRCLYRTPPPAGEIPSCAQAGVLGVLPGIVGTIQATETIKLILGIGDTLVGRLLLIDALHMSIREVKLRRDPNCPICGENPTIHELLDYEEVCGLDTCATDELVDKV